MLENPGIIRSRAKIEATIGGAKALLAMEDAGVEFSEWVWEMGGWAADSEHGAAGREHAAGGDVFEGAEEAGLQVCGAGDCVRVDAGGGDRERSRRGVFSATRVRKYPAQGVTRRTLSCQLDMRTHGRAAKGREILNRTNEMFFRHFWKLVAPALLAGFLGYWVGWSNGWLQKRLSYVVWRHAHGNANAAIRGVVIPGVALRLVVMGAEFMVWGAAFAAISSMVVSLNDGGPGSLRSAFRSVSDEPGMLSLLWRLCGWLVISGYLVLIASGAIGFWFFTRLQVDLLTPRGRFCSEIFRFLFLVLFTRFLFGVLRLPSPCPSWLERHRSIPFLPRGRRAAHGGFRSL